MNSHKTESEGAFEEFLSRHQLAFEPVATAESRRPDYLVTCGALKIFFEVKQISKDDEFSDQPLEVGSRTIGDHVRQKIANAKRQIQWGVDQGNPSVLLIYNALDPFQMFGTEDHDFLCAMYGEYTLVLDSTTGEKLGQFHGWNHSVAPERNTSFSALGKLALHYGELKVTLFENAFAKLPIPYDALPLCFGVVRVEVAP